MDLESRKRWSDLAQIALNEFGADMRSRGMDLHLNRHKRGTGSDLMSAFRNAYESEGEVES